MDGEASSWHSLKEAYVQDFYRLMMMMYSLITDTIGIKVWVIKRTGISSSKLFCSDRFNFVNLNVIGCEFFKFCKLCETLSHAVKVIIYAI